MFMYSKMVLLLIKLNAYKLSSIIISVIIFVTFTGCNIIPEEEEIVPPQLVKSVSVQYELYKAERKTIQNELIVDGVFTSSRQHSLSFKKAGYRLKSIYVSTGNLVKKGDIIVDLDNDNIKSKIKYQNAEIKKAQLRYKQVEIDYNVLKEDPNSNSSSLEKTRINMEIMMIDMEILRLQMEELEKEYENTYIKSPIDGVVAYVDAALSEGSVVEAYKTIALILDPSDLLLECNIPSKSLDKISSGMECKVKINKDSYDAVIVVSPDDLPENIKESKPNTAQIVVKDISPEVKSGDLATMSVVIEIKEDVIVVPKSAVRTFDNRDYVVILEENGKKEVDVELGMQTSTAFEVISGLEEGQDVIIK